MRGRKRGEEGEKDEGELIRVGDENKWKPGEREEREGRGEGEEGTERGEPGSCFVHGSDEGRGERGRK